MNYWLCHSTVLSHLGKLKVHIILPILLALATLPVMIDDAVCMNIGDVNYSKTHQRHPEKEKRAVLGRTQPYRTHVSFFTECSTYWATYQGSSAGGVQSLLCNTMCDDETSHYTFRIPAWQLSNWHYSPICIVLLKSFPSVYRGYRGENHGSSFLQSHQLFASLCILFPLKEETCFLVIIRGQ